MATISGTIIESDHPLSLAELTRALAIHEEFIHALIEQGLIAPTGNNQSDWAFDSLCLKRARLARNFHIDLEVNLPGIALALDLLDEIERLT